MEDIFVPPDSGTSKTSGGWGDTRSGLPLADPPPENSGTSDEEVAPGQEPLRTVFKSNRRRSFIDSDSEISDFEGFPEDLYQFEGCPLDSPEPEGFPLDPSQSEELPLDPSELEGFPHVYPKQGISSYHPYRLPRSCSFDSPELPASAASSEDDSIHKENQNQDSSTSGSDYNADDDVTVNKKEGREGDEAEEEEEVEGEEDWSMATSEQWQVVSDHFQDGHSTPSGFVVPSIGTPSIPDDLMSFTSDQDVGSFLDEVEPFLDEVASFHEDRDQDEVSFYTDEGNGNDSDNLKSNIGVLWNFGDMQASPAVRSKTRHVGHLSREDTLEDDSVDMGCPPFYDINDNVECSMHLGDPLLSSLVVTVDEVRTGQDDNFQNTKEADEDMDTPRVTFTSHIASVTSLHSLCRDNSVDPDALSRAGGSTDLNPLRVPQAGCQDANPSLESSQEEESFFDSGNFQRVDDAYEYYPTNIQARKVKHPSAVFSGHHHLFRSFRRRPKRGKAKRKSKDRKTWKLRDQRPEYYPI